MIGISLQGQLGNQMFQYAAARIAAERLGCGLVVHQNRIEGRSFPYCFGTGRIVAKIGDVFPSARQSHTGVLMQLISEHTSEKTYGLIHRTLFPRSFTPRRMTIEGDPGVEIFDPEFESIISGTWLSGYFQSRLYFSGFEKSIERWFQLPSERQKEVDHLVRTFPAPPEDMVAVHFRRSDYLTQRNALGHPHLGWALPIGYYREAFAQLPNGLRFAVFSDDPVFARNVISAADPWVSSGTDAETDLFLMASCRHMIIANSSFSWWAAWLNRSANKVVLAPKHHIGWFINTWCPGGIDVPTWKYIDVVQ